MNALCSLVKTDVFAKSEAEFGDIVSLRVENCINWIDALLCGKERSDYQDTSGDQRVVQVSFMIEFP